MMTGSPLARFRRQGAPEAEAATPTKPVTASALKPYRAFDPQDRVMSLDIHRVLGPTHSPGYAYLLNLAYDNEYFTNFVLYYTFLRVEVRGQHLREVIQAIKLRKCEYIQDFHPEEFELPAEGQPLIESIRIVWLDANMAAPERSARNPAAEPA
jgi:hypothetical protein